MMSEEVPQEEPVEITEYERLLSSSPEVLREGWDLNRNTLLAIAALHTVYLISVWQSDVREPLDESLGRIIDSFVEADLHNMPLDDGWHRLAVYVLFRAIGLAIPIAMVGALSAESLILQTKQSNRQRPLNVFMAMFALLVGGLLSIFSTGAVAYITSPPIGRWFACAVIGVLIVGIVGSAISNGRKELRQFFNDRKRRKTELAAMKQKIAEAKRPSRIDH